MNITFFVPGEVKGLARPRASSFGGHTRLYDPAKNRTEKGLLQHYLHENWRGGIVEPGPMGFSVELIAAFPTPKSMSKKNTALAMADMMRVQKKPDADNIVKLVLDAYNLMIWRDDSSVTSVTVKKIYSNNPGLKVSISWEGEEDG